MYFSTEGAGTDFLKKYPQVKLLWEQFYSAASLPTTQSRQQVAVIKLFISTIDALKPTP